MKFNLLSVLVIFLLFPLRTNAKEIVLRKYIIVVALESETSNFDLDKFAPIVYTGFGKVNAAIELYGAILRYKPDLVINYGTAGSITRSNGLYHIDTFIQRDMDARALGVPRGITPFSNQKSPQVKGVVLGTGDSFVTNAKKQLEGLTFRIDLVDMEGYALMEVCKHFEIEFQCYKFVSDSANKNASSEWNKNISNGVEIFKKTLTKKYGYSKLTTPKSYVHNTLFQLPFLNSENILNQ